MTACARFNEVAVGAVGMTISSWHRLSSGVVRPVSSGPNRMAMAFSWEIETRSLASL